LLLGIQLTGKSGDICSHPVKSDGSEQLLDESFAARPAFGDVGAVDPVNQFNDCDCRQGAS